MFGLDNNVLMGLVGVVVVFCLMTNKKSFKSLMKKDMLVIIGLTLLLACCCLSKGGRIEGFDPGQCEYPNIGYAFNWYNTHVGPGKLFSMGADGTLIINDNHSEFCSLESSVITEMQCLLNSLSGAGMGGISNTIIDKLDGIKARCEVSDTVKTAATAAPSSVSAASAATIAAANRARPQFPQKGGQ